jgi:hypothetical protein
LTAEKAASTQKRGKRKPSPASRIVKESCAIVFWGYIISKLFVFDFDNFLIDTYSPRLHFLLDYKLIFIFFTLAVLWLVLGKKRFMRFLLYVASYPFLIFLWRIPKRIFRKWTFAIIFTPAIFELIASFRSLFISHAFGALAALCILLTSNPNLLAPSMAVLAVLLALHLYSSFQRAYRATVFSRIADLLSRLRAKLSDAEFLQKILLTKQVGDKSDGSQMDLNKRISTLYFFHWGTEFAAQKIRGIAQTRKMDLYLILSWFWTILFSSLIFAFEYLALFKMDAGSFLAPSDLNFLSFFGFSFGTLILSSISEISPASSLAAFLCYVQQFCSLVILVILVFIILTAARERYKEDIENLVCEFRNVALMLQESCQTIFNLALEEAEALLLRDNAKLINEMRRLRGLPELPLPKEEAP